MTVLIYVELKTGFNGNGPAWIGMPAYSRSKTTIYFNGLALKRIKGSGISGNHYDAKTGDEYWVSGVKKNGQDRHWAGGGKVFVDRAVITEYLDIIKQKILPKNLISVDLLPSEPTAEHREQEHSSL